jgi:hypothetical protein
VVVSPTPSVVAQEVRGVVPPTPSVVVQEAVLGTEDVILRLPRHLRSTMTCMRVRRKHCQRVSAGRRSGVDASVVVGFQDSFAIFSVMREIPTVEPTVTVGFCGVMVGREGRASVGSRPSLFVGRIG